MTLKEDFQAAATEIFDVFESVAIQAIYVQQSSTYVAGGNQVVTEIEHTVRLIKDTDKGSAVREQATEVLKAEITYLMITSELPVVPNTKDYIEIDGFRRAILAIESDPANIVTTFRLSS